MATTQTQLKAVSEDAQPENDDETSAVRPTTVAQIVRDAGPEGELGDFWPTVAAREASSDTVERLIEGAC